MQKHAHHQTSHSSILLVEDEEIARASLTRMLAMRFPELRILTAENGCSGLELYRRHLPDLIITDINMPKLSGIEMARAIRAEAPAARIIALSAHSEAAYLASAIESGISHYMLKPVDRHELFDVVGRCLEGRDC